MTEKEAQEAKRHKRVDRLKKGIMGLFVFAVLAPIVLTVVFTLRINSLEKRLRDVTGNLEKLQAEEQKSAVEAYVSALGILPGRKERPDRKPPPDRKMSVGRRTLPMRRMSRSERFILPLTTDPAPIRTIFWIF